MTEVEKFIQTWPEPFLELQLSGQVAWSNRAAQESCCERKLDPGASLFEIFSEQNKARIQSWMQSPQRDQSLRVVEKKFQWTLVLVAEQGKIFALAQGVGTLQSSSAALSEELELSREKLSRISKMASLGEMTSGMAHEINNPLTIILSKVMAARISMKSAQPDREVLEKSLDLIEDTARRIAKIVRGMRSFARDGSKDALEPASVKAIFEETIPLCKYSLDKLQVKIEVLGVKDDMLIRCIPVQISQVLVNLINNARDACESKTEKWIRVEAADAGDDIRIEVTDSGDGIPAAVRARIMEPFFTTKPAGKGSGLGLSISKTIIDAHGGKLWLDPRSPNTKFCVQIPKARSAS